MGCCELGAPFRGCRHGYHAARECAVGVGAVEIKMHRVADVPAEALGLRVRRLEAAAGRTAPVPPHLRQDRGSGAPGVSG